MKTYPLSTLAEACGGQLMSGDASMLLEGGVSTDTRSIAPGSLFVALQGERFDAHDFIDEAAQSAAAVMVSAEVSPRLPCAVIRVDDTLLALQRLAAWYRRQLPVKVIGITGSNGKTSTKDFTKAVLEQGFNCFATRGNLNNHIGVPLSLLSLEESHQVAVIEMGMNHPGEIAPLCQIARPDLGIITNIGTAHIENMGSRDAIADEKSALARSLPDHGTLLVPAACDYADYIAERCRGRVIFAGNCRGQVRAESILQDLDSCRFKLIVGTADPIEVTLPIPGRHMVTNALLAAGIGHALGLAPSAIARGLSSAHISSGRLRRFQSRGCQIIDDSYNANPESITAALQTLAECPIEEGGRRFALLGHMAELGDRAPAAHERIGHLAAQLGIDAVIALGPLATGIASAAREASTGTVLDFEKHEDAAAALEARIKPGDLVLFKGSRSAATEKVMHLVFPEDSPSATTS